MVPHHLRQLGLVLVLSTVACNPTAQEFEQDRLPENHLVYTCLKTGEGFKGENENLPGFEFAMVISAGAESEPQTIASLKEAIREGRVTGTLTYPHGVETEIEFEIVEHRGKPDIYMKTRLGFFLWERERVRDDEVTFVIDFWYTPPAVEADLEALTLAMESLEDSSAWLREDDRRCESEQWSLFCALKYAIRETQGEYNHHATAMNVVRELIAEEAPDVDYEHALMDYNNAATTRHEDLMDLLRRARDRISQDLGE